MSQDTFNKITSLIILLWCIGIASYAIITGREVTITNAVMPFITYILSHFGQLVYDVQNNKTSIQAANNKISPDSIAAVKQVVSSPSQSQNGSTNGGEK